MHLWFQDSVPQHFSVALRDLVRALYEQSHLRDELSREEQDDDNRHNPISQADGEAAAAANLARAVEDDVVYGMEQDPEIHISTIGAITIPHFENLEQDERYIRTCFEVRKVRLEHEDSQELRWRHHQPFVASLDHSVKNFCRRTIATYIDANSQPRQALPSTFVELLQDMGKYAAALV
jgi:hypothetical protein